MKTRTILQWGLLLVLCLGVMGAECPSIPTVGDREVDLVVGASIVVPFEATGSGGSINLEERVDLTEKIDLRKLLDDAGIDISGLKEIGLYRASYRVVRPDPTEDRAISGQVLVGDETPADRILIPALDVPSVNSVAAWVPAGLHADGVNLINGMLNGYRDYLQTGELTTPLTFSCRVDGEVGPSNNINFRWELKLDINVVGTIKVKVLG